MSKQTRQEEELLHFARGNMDSAASRIDIRERCFRFLNEFPDAARVRLVLAKSFYLDGIRDFCVRELLQIKDHHPVAGLLRLLESLGVETDSSSEAAELQVEPIDTTVAELDLDVELAEFMDSPDRDREN